MLTLFLISKFALLRSNNFIMSVKRFLVAMCKPVSPWQSCALTNLASLHNLSTGFTRLVLPEEQA